jgi:arginase family enzyme
MEEKLADRLVQVGIRTANGHQREQMSKLGVEVLEMKDLHSVLELEFKSPTYVSLDLDALDPAYAPGVSHYEPGGLSTREVIRLIQSLKAGVVGADVVEFNPKRDVQGMTAMVCAKLIKEIAAKILVGDTRSV